jgi:hypothetical protein
VQVLGGWSTYALSRYRIFSMDGAQIDEARRAIGTQYPDEFQYPLVIGSYYSSWFNLSIASLFCILKLPTLPTRNRDITRPNGSTPTAYNT